MTKLIGIIYDYDDRKTDFYKYLDRKNCLIIYNEHEMRFNDKNDYAKGGGNAFLRQFRSDGTRGFVKSTYALGIPTDSDDMKSVEYAVKQIIYYTQKYNIKYVLMAVEPNGRMGLGFLACNKKGIECANYATTLLRNYFTDIGHYPRGKIEDHGDFFDITTI